MSSSDLELSSVHSDGVAAEIEESQITTMTLLASQDLEHDQTTLNPDDLTCPTFINVCKYCLLSYVLTFVCFACIIIKFILFLMPLPRACSSCYVSLSSGVLFTVTVLLSLCTFVTKHEVFAGQKTCI